MKKSKGIVSLVLRLALLMDLLGFTPAVGFGYCQTGSARNINLGLDLAGGVSITYQAKDEESVCRRYEGYDLQAAEACRAVQHRGECISGRVTTGSTSRSRVYPMPIRFWKNLANRDHWYFRMQMATPFLKEQMLKMQRLRRRKTLRLRIKSM